MLFRSCGIGVAVVGCSINRAACGCVVGAVIASCDVGAAGCGIGVAVVSCSINRAVGGYIVGAVIGSCDVGAAGCGIGVAVVGCSINRAGQSVKGILTATMGCLEAKSLYLDQQHKIGTHPNLHAIWSSPLIEALFGHLWNQNTAALMGR